jgi:transcriptional regulator with XRE-family HTH domain
MSALRHARVNAKLSVTDLASLSKISPEQIRNLEAGRARNPRVETLVKLSDALGVEPADIDPMLGADLPSGSAEPETKAAAA